MSGLDHIVLACRDLDQTASHFERAGFTLTPEAHHSWGTANRLVQLDGGFLEILTVDKPDLIAPDDGRQFSFGGHNQAFLAREEGASMMVLRGNGRPDQQRFERTGIGQFELFSFDRTAFQPDGSAKTVAFDLAFATSQRLSNISFFTCLNKYPENFWKADYQHHANGAHTLDRITIVANTPDEHQQFLSTYADQSTVTRTHSGIDFKTGAGTISVITPDRFEASYGQPMPGAPDLLPTIGAYDVIVDNIEKTKSILDQNNQPFRTVGPRVVLEAGMPGITSLAFLSV